MSAPTAAIYGAGMGETIKVLASDHVDPVGFVENIADAYDRHRIFVAPLLSGAGIKGKVVSAIAHGIPHGADAGRRRGDRAAPRARLPDR